MAFGGNRSGGTLSDINVTPLVDVMLVLLIIFMVTAPLVSQRIGIDLPQVGPTPPSPAKPETVHLRIEANGGLFWDGIPLAYTDLPGRLAVEADRGDAQPTIEVDASPDAAYEPVADVLASARNAGVVKIAFAESTR